MMCILELGFGQIAASAPTLGKMLHIYDIPSKTDAAPGQIPVQLKIIGTPRNLSNRFSSHSQRDTDSNLTLVPKSRGENTPRISRATCDEESNALGIVQNVSFSILKAEKGPEGEGNFWKIEAERR